jgi:NB-ARC domain
MTQLKSFKAELLEMLNTRGSFAVPEVFSLIEASGYDYNKSGFANLRNDAKGLVTDPDNYIIRLQVFIGTLSGEYSKKIHYQKPYPPDYFIGRVDVLKEIHNTLTSAEQRNSLVLLSGIGGMGKTTLMQKYLNEDNCLKYFNNIIVVKVNNNLQSAFIANVVAALNLDITRRPLVEDQLKLVKKELSELAGQSLLVIDNINQEDYDDLVSLKGHLKEIGLKVLITTRTEPKGFDIIRVPELSEDEAKLLFYHHYAPDDEVDCYNEQALLEYIGITGEEEETKMLLRHITRHTLLTELLAKAGKERGFSISQLFEFLIQQDIKNPELQTLVEIGEHAETTFNEEQKTAKIYDYITGIFDTDYLFRDTGNEHVNAENNAKIQMLQFFSVLPTGDIPIKHLAELWLVKQDEMLPFEERLRLLRLIGWLQGKQLKKRDPKFSQNLYFSMHSLVQKVVYDKLRPDINNCRPLVMSITKLLSNPLDTPREYQNYGKSIIDKLTKLDRDR